MKYGEHPTSLSTKSDVELYGMFRVESWNNLDEASRLELLQETCNRAAASHGEIGSCKVEFSNLDATEAGRQFGNRIQLNREMFVNNRQIKTLESGQTITRTLPDANLQALVTVLHEDEHAFQNQVINGDITIDNHRLALEYSANDFNDVELTNKDGSVQNGTTYLQGNTAGLTGYYAYYFQPTERDAHKFSEERTMQIVEMLEVAYGTEKSFDAFRMTTQNEGFDAITKMAEQTFGGIDVQREINNSLMNHFYNTSYTVSTEIENLVVSEMVLTYEDIHQEMQLTQDNVVGTSIESTEETIGTEKNLSDFAGFEVFDLSDEFQNDVDIETDIGMFSGDGLDDGFGME